MENQISLKLANYEKDFLSFQVKLPRLREETPDRFIAFKNGRVVSSNESIDKLLKDLNSKNINPSETVIEFVSKNEIKVIV